MKEVIITADSAADIPQNIAREYGIKIMPMHVIAGGEEKNDGVDITAPQVFDYVDKTGKIPKTSAVSPGEYMNFFGSFVKEGKAVVHLSFCSTLSSTCRNAKIASARFDNVYPLDTRSLAGGISLLALKGCRLRDEGMSAEDIFVSLSSLIAKSNVSYLLDNIDFLRRSGRCSAAAAIGANLFSIKPCAAMVDGKIDVIKKYIGKAQTVRMQYTDDILSSNKNIDFETAFLYHSGVDSKEINAVADKLKNAGFERVITAFTGCMISLHSGRNAMGIHFLTK